MNNEIFSSKEFEEDVAACLRKMTSKNESFVALRKARSEAFIEAYMVDPKHLERAYLTDSKHAIEINVEDIESAPDLTFAEWLKYIDVREYFVDQSLLDALLKKMSADELKLILADEMEIYYDAFREDRVCSVFGEGTKTAENHDHDGDSCTDDREGEDEDEGKSFIDLMTEVFGGHENDEDREDDEGEEADEDEDDEDEEAESLGKTLVSLVDLFEKFCKEKNKKGDKKKNENKGN